MSNIWALEPVLTGEYRRLFYDLINTRARIADIGCADGDMGLFLQTQGCQVDLVDNPPTNINAFLGARRLDRALGAGVNFHEADLDQQFSLPADYDFALFLGILYHIKNPFYVLETLAKRVRRIALSTRVTGGIMGNVPGAYLLAPDECNNDPTNFWIFTDAGLRRLFERTGWDVLTYTIIGGDMETSDPASAEGDRRAFCLLQSRR
jgi:hypothetical protein